MGQEKELTPEQELKARLNSCVAQYREAIKWLRHAKIYQGTYAADATFDGKIWKDDIEGELAKDANKAYNEAVSSVLYWRKQLDAVREKLMSLGKRKGNV